MCQGAKSYLCLSVYTGVGDKLHALVVAMVQREKPASLRWTSSSTHVIGALTHIAVCMHLCIAPQ